MGQGKGGGPELAQYYSEKQDDGRAYRHPFRVGENGKPIVSPSITTVLKLENKDNLIQWAADKTLDWCILNWHLLGSRSDEDARRTARYQWSYVRNERAEVGTGIHRTVECEHLGLWDFPELDEEQELIMLEWRALNEEYEIEPLLTECTVWNFTEDYAGTADGLWRFTHRVTGVTFVAWVDLKTSRNTWPGHWMQLAAIVNAEVIMAKQADGTWRETEMPEFDEIVIVHLRAPSEQDGDGKHEIKFAKDMDLRWEQFKHYRGLWEIERSLKARDKESNEDGF